VRNNPVPELDVGLCATCTHVRVMRSDRRSTFYQCALSFTNPAYPKYPRLPVLTCAGYAKRNDD
jgi:hypothetical protein